MYVCIYILYKIAFLFRKYYLKYYFIDLIR